MDLYYSIASAPCRAVIMTAAAVGAKLNLIGVNIMAGDHLKPEFTSINPQHTIPTLVDDGFAIWESRAIQQYLVEKYGKYDDPLYPKEIKKRAMINQRLYFDMGTLYKTFADYFYPQFLSKKPAAPDAFDKVKEALDLLNTFLVGQTYVAGDEFSVADISILATISTYDAAGIDFSSYSHVMHWYKNCKTIAPGWKENWEGCVLMREYIQNHKSDN